MMEQYEFTETSSRAAEENGEQVRVVTFRGAERTTGGNHRLNVDGSFTMPLMEYFKAGMEGRLSETIRDKVIERLTLEGAQEEDTEGA